MKLNKCLLSDDIIGPVSSPGVYRAEAVAFLMSCNVMCFVLFK